MESLSLRKLKRISFRWSQSSNWSKSWMIQRWSTTTRWCSGALCISSVILERTASSSSRSSFHPSWTESVWMVKTTPSVFSTTASKWSSGMFPSVSASTRTWSLIPFSRLSPSTTCSLLKSSCSSAGLIWWVPRLTTHKWISSYPKFYISSKQRGKAQNIVSAATPLGPNSRWAQSQSPRLRSTIFGNRLFKWSKNSSVSPKMTISTW